MAELHPELTLTELPEKYCPAGSCFTARTGEALRRAFRQIYDAPERLAFEVRASAGLVGVSSLIGLCESAATDSAAADV